MNAGGTIRYRLTAEEVAYGWMKHRRHAKHWWLRTLMVVIGASMTLYSALYERPLGISFVSAVAFTLTAAILLVSTPWQLQRHYLKAARANPEFTEDKEVSFDAEGMNITHATGRSSFTWTRVKKLTEDTQYFYLYANRSVPAMSLPKRAFDADSEAAFRRCSQSVPRA